MSAIPNKFRFVTRSDFDGLVRAMLFRHLEVIDDTLFVNLKDMHVLFAETNISIHVLWGVK